MAIAKAGKIWQIAKRWHIRDSLSAVFRATIGTLSFIAARQTVPDSSRLSYFDTRGMVQGFFVSMGRMSGHSVHLLPHFTLNSAIRFAFGGIRYRLPTDLLHCFTLRYHKYNQAPMKRPGICHYLPARPPGRMAIAGWQLPVADWQHSASYTTYGVY